MYDTYKKYNKKIYTGMRVGGSHSWIYTDGKWFETKITPDKWNINFDPNKPFAPTSKIFCKITINVFF